MGSQAPVDYAQRQVHADHTEGQKAQQECERCSHGLLEDLGVVRHVGLSADLRDRLVQLRHRSGLLPCRLDGDAVVVAGVLVCDRVAGEEL